MSQHPKQTALIAAI